MSYAVKEIFYSLQGEGAQSGRSAVFCRFSGCNLWSGRVGSGRERDRATAACQFCDTDFFGTDGFGGGRFASANELVEAIVSKWPAENGMTRFVVCTGGESLLQLDQVLVDTLHEQNCEVAIETNGSLQAPKRIDWICISPKAGATLALCEADELKLVFPQEGLSPD